MKHLLLVCLFAFAALALTDEEWTHVNIMNLQAQKLQKQVETLQDIQICLDDIKVDVEGIKQLLTDIGAAKVFEAIEDCVTEAQDIIKTVNDCKGSSTELINAFIRKSQA